MKENIFKVGNKVKCLPGKNDWNLEAEKIYTIKKVKGNMVILEEVYGEYFKSRFCDVEGNPSPEARESIF